MIPPGRALHIAGNTFLLPNNGRREGKIVEEKIQDIKIRLKKQGLLETLHHFELAEKMFCDGHWEAANSQVRTFLESLFDAVAAILLKSSLKGGSARKELAEKGFLGERENKFIKSFMDLAGESGSHAGISNQDEGSCRWFCSLGIAFIGLSLIPDAVKVEEVFRAQLKAPNGTNLPKDKEIITECPTCGQTQNLSEAELYRDGQESVYICKNGCQPIVVIGLPGDSPWPGRGYRLGNYVIRNAKDLYFFMSGGKVLIPTSPASLMKKT